MNILKNQIIALEGKSKSLINGDKSLNEKINNLSNNEIQKKQIILNAALAVLNELGAE